MKVEDDGSVTGDATTYFLPTPTTSGEIMSRTEKTVAMQANVVPSIKYRKTGKFSEQEKQTLFTYARIEYEGKCVVARINDKGPYHEYKDKMKKAGDKYIPHISKILDLSPAVYDALTGEHTVKTRKPEKGLLNNVNVQWPVNPDGSSCK
ncbi:hypothetical protein MCHI_001993 [Candidatus Magnetoovum chiemensis]|nr:hypothetical protein MCHI_001993 [Candidatus Magnetoovum chiemensis]